MMERLRDMVVEDFDISQISPIEEHMNAAKELKENIERVEETLAYLKEKGINSVISVNYQKKVIRLPSEEFMRLAEIAEPKIEESILGKKGKISMGDVEIHALLNEGQVSELMSTKYPFRFWYCENVVTNLGEFYDALDKVPLNSIKHHLSQGDFSKWLSFIGEEELSKRFAEFEGKENYGEDVRATLRNVLLSYVEEQIKKRLNI
ncbi:hypothetical protein DRN62_02245 [Nanoarchaeota archaeon]|mgnify:CR=1 FL=1|nr:MAG: hypothetical protein DRN62_02245 [Nanoarchaeota archaeon]